MWMKRQTGRVRTGTITHPFQEDSFSCGVFVIMVNGGGKWLT